MAEITASLVKELREKTGAGMMDCKKALGEVAGDRREGGRLAAHQGPVGGLEEGRPRRRRRPGRRGRRTAPRGAVLEVNAETDFVGRNDQFQKFVGDGDQARARQWRRPRQGRGVAVSPAPAATCRASSRNLIATIGENMSLRRAASLSVSDGVVVAYTHNAVATGPRQDRRAGRPRDRPATRPSSGALAKQLGHARGRDQPAVADGGRARPGGDRARARGARREGRPAGQGRRHRRQDGRGRPAQVPPGGRAARAGLRDGRQDQGRRRSSRTPPSRSARRSAWRASCASRWARASRRSRKISRPRWLPSSRSSIKTSRRAGTWARVPKTNVIRGI